MENQLEPPIQETPEQTPVEQPAQPEKTSILSSKWLKIGGILLVLLLLLGGAYFLGTRKNSSKPTPASVVQIPTPTPTSNPTADWKTYTATTYVIKYPPNFHTSTQSPALNIIDTTGQFDLVINTEPTNLNIDDYINQKSWCTSINSTTGQPYEIDNENFLRFEKNPCGQAGSTDLYAVHNSTAYHLSIGTQEKYDSLHPTLNKILSTFKFTNPTSPSSDETSNVQNRVKDFYSKYLAGTPSARDVDQLKTDGYLTDNAVTQIKQAVGADLVTCSQNPLNAGDYTYATPQVNTNTATMAVSGYYSGGSGSTVTINLSLIKSATTWTIDSFSCAK